MPELLRGKTILVGICGSISAYKAPLLVRLFVKEGANVHVVMTDSATKFVSPLTLTNLSKNAVITDMFASDIQENGSWHIHLARKCDAMIVAPCSAKTLASLAHGYCDTALVALAVALPHSTPLIVAPAMDSDMWEHPTTQRNWQQVSIDGCVTIEPEIGELASGVFGKGRLADPEVLFQKTVDILCQSQLHTTEHTSPPLDGKNVVITTGPTYERIDDVRFIGNFSSGKMGFALAKEAQRLGANVTIIAGPVQRETPKNIQRVDVESAEEMFNAVQEIFPTTDIIIMAAAVADFTPEKRHNGKIKKSEQNSSLTLDLIKTTDILSWLGSNKKAHQFVCGFALESDNLESYAETKLIKKNADMIVANYAGGQQSGFGGDDNTITILERHVDSAQQTSITSFEPMTKYECAMVIIDRIIKHQY